MFQNRNNRGITLIVLVVTIIVMLILVGITITEIKGDGLIDKTITARDKNNKSEAEEAINLKITGIQVKSYAQTQKLPDLQYLADALNVDDEIEYVSLTSKKIASKEPIKLTDENKSIFTKLKKYKYEFEINDKLQLASINGEKVANSTVKEVKAKINITDIKSTSFVVNVEAEKPEDVLLYLYYIDGNLVYQGTENSYKVSGLKLSTKYNVKVSVIPKTLVDIGQLDQITDSTPEVEFANKFDKYIYIDANNGSDSTGDGSKEKPYKTLNFISQNGIITTNYSYAIILKDGTYELTENIFNLNCNKEINIIGNRQNTTLSVKNIFGSAYPGGKSYPVNIYRLIWDANGYGGTNTIFPNNKLSLYSVLLTNIKEASYGYFIAANGGEYLYNCTVNNNCAVTCRDNCGTLQLTNCYGYFYKGLGPGNFNYKTNRILGKGTYILDSNYQITEDESLWKNVGTGNDLDETKTDLGIYGGSYSWSYGTDLD